MQNVLKHTLKAKAHHLRPIILVGVKGLTDGVIKETDNALKTHELIKVKISGMEKEDRQKAVADLCTSVKAELVQAIGHTIVIYRKNEDTN